MSTGRDERRATPLHSIARLGITTIAEVLVAHGADINAKDNAAWTPLNIAAGRGQKDMVELLITKGADINAKDKRGSTPLHRAITAEPTVPKAGRKATVEFLLARGADFTIHDVAWVGDVARVRKLLESNPSLARNANRALFAAIREGHSTIVELLLDNGAKLSTKGRFKEPPLHAAAYSGHRDMAALLLRKGADVNRKGAHGELALHWAAAKGHGEITRLLVEAGAEVNTHTDTTRADVDVLPAGDDADVIHEQLRYLTDCEKQEQAMAAGSSLQIMG
ncbi:MAG: ankyrin repeat domain-containing protein, partial [Planctomycetota bacterium]